VESHEEYVSPKLIELGTVEEFTQGNLGRGNADRLSRFDFLNILT
jgi:hypothetical protein